MDEKFNRKPLWFKLVMIAILSPAIAIIVILNVFADIIRHHSVCKEKTAVEDKQGE